MILETMSMNIVETMITLSKNEMLGKLLVNDVSTPYADELKGKKLLIPDPKFLINQTLDDPKISPYPFDEDGVTATSGSFIRVYYNDGQFNDNQTIAESELHIDIICSKDLWLINNDPFPENKTISKADVKSIIRPYDIAGRVVDLVGKRSVGKHPKLKFKGFQHLYISKKFQCIRLYADYMSVETLHEHMKQPKS